MPLDLLARAQLAASSYDGTLIHEPGFRVLAACARVSRHWRAATLAAAALAPGARLPDVPSALQSPQLQAWSARGVHAIVHVHDSPMLLRGPALGEFLAGCPALVFVFANGDPRPEGFNVACFEVALAAVPGLADLYCASFVPTGCLPASLHCLRLASLPENTDFESLFVRLQLLHELGHVGFFLEGHRHRLQLRQDMLREVQLPASFTSLEIRLDCLHGSPELDLGWLAGPRSFAVSLELIERRERACLEWEQPLQALQGGVLRSKDKLQLVILPEHLSSAARALLDGLRLAGVSVVEREQD